MKILHCFHEYLHTSENWAYRLIISIPNIEVFITSKKFIKNNFYNQQFQYIKFPLQQISFPTKSNLSFWIRGTNKIISIFRQLYPLYLLKQAKGIHIVHSHFAHVAWQYHPITKKLNVPHVISFYGFDYENLPYKEPIYKDRYQILYKEAAAFICEGNHGANILVKNGCSADKVHVIRLGVEAEKIPFFNRTKRPNELHLIQIASFSEKKGHIYTVKAFIKALNDCPNMKLTLVGPTFDQHVRDAIVNLVHEHDINERIKFVPSVDFALLYEYLNNFQVFIHPSCYSSSYDCEGGAPVVLIDAQATGMPVISTQHCDIPDIVADKKSGLLSPEKNVEALVESIRYFYKMEQEEYNAFAKFARQHVESVFDIKKNAVKLKKIYDSLTEPGRNKLTYVSSDLY
jgi:colanic acid/amylovoran biosynthesis glycosyltransferase